MNSHRIAFVAVAVAAAFVAVTAGCASVPKPLAGEYAAISARDAAIDSRTGDHVRWGGLVIEVEPQAERTCIQILSRELTDSARPRQRDASEGRFVACRDGFYDPEIFAQGREVTVIGTVVAMTTRTIGEYPYPMPEVAAEAVYLWPERVDRNAYYDPFWPWIGYYPHRWGFGYWHHRHPRPSKPQHHRSQPPRTDKSSR